MGDDNDNDNDEYERFRAAEMGNVLCPPIRPEHSYYTEGAGQRYGGHASARVRTTDDEDSKHPKLSSSEINHLPIEEFHLPKEMMRWSVSQLRAELNRARRNSPADRSVLDGPMPLEKAELVEAVQFARGGESGARCNICFDEYETGDG